MGLAPITPAMRRKVARIAMMAEQVNQPYKRAAKYQPQRCKLAPRVVRSMAKAYAASDDAFWNNRQPMMGDRAEAARQGFIAGYHAARRIEGENV